MFSQQNGSTTGQNIHPGHPAPAVGPMKPARRLEPRSSEKSVAEVVCFYLGEHPPGSKNVTVLKLVQQNPNWPCYFDISTKDHPPLNIPYKPPEPATAFWGAFMRCPFFKRGSNMFINQSVLPFGCDVNKKQCNCMRFRFGWTLHQNRNFITLKNCQFIRMVYWNCHFTRRGIHHYNYIYIYCI